MQKNSRGGVKPTMMTGSTEWALEMGQGYEKKGMYEYHDRLGELARRVELPHWLASYRQTLSPVAFKAALSKGTLTPPKEDIAESGGHIWLKPAAALGWSGAAVGIDEAIFTRLTLQGDSFKGIRFMGYDPGYQLAFSWRMSANDFKEHAKLIQTKPPFMPQWMVPIDLLKMVVSR